MKEKVIIGWREWLKLPDLGIERIKAKVDTGARTSSLHASNIRFENRGGQKYVLFEVHPLQRDSHRQAVCEAPLLEWRYVRNSGGKRTLRPVIETVVEIGEHAHVVELTLISRDEMGFRMLLGRQAIKSDYWVDPARSYLLRRDRPKKVKSKIKKKTTATRKKSLPKKRPL